MQKNYNELRPENVAKRVKKMIEARAEMINRVNELHVKFSQGNRKTGAIPSVSLIPVADCVNCGDCSRGCYDLRHDCIYPQVIEQRANNSAIFALDPDRFFEEIRAYVVNCHEFRYNIGGGIPNAYYFDRVVEIARVSPWCKFLIFTKNYKVVNLWIGVNGELPENLHVVLSNWKNTTIENKYNLPTSWAKFPAGVAINPEYIIPDNAVKCNDNCALCAIHGVNCFGMNKGQSIYFDAH